MHRWDSLTSAARVLACAGCLALTACGDDPRVLDGEQQVGSRSADVGQVQFRLDVGAEEIVGGVRYQITSPEQPAIMGVLSPEPGGKILTVTVELPAGRGYMLLVAAYREGGQETCMIRATFDVIGGTLSRVDLILECDPLHGGGNDAGIADGGGDTATLDASADARAPHADSGRDATVDARGPSVDATAAKDGAADASREAAGDAALLDGASSAADAAVDGSHAAPAEAAAGPAPVDTDAASAPQTSDAGSAGNPPSAADAGPSERDATVAVDRDACNLCSQRECARSRGLDRMRDCIAAPGSLTTGPGAGASRAGACAAVLDCAHDTACSLGSALGCYCGPASSAQSCQGGAIVGACRAEVEVAAQSTEPQRIVSALSDDDTLLFAAARILSCEAERCRLACFGTP